MNKNKKIVTYIIVGAVIIDKEKVLLLKRHTDEKVYPNFWELPSGKKNPLELTKYALKREVKEETNLEVIQAEPFYVFDYQIEKPLEIRDSVQINFLTSVVDPGTVKISREHQEFMWLAKEDLRNYEITKLTRVTIEKAFDFLAGHKKIRN